MATDNTAYEILITGDFNINMADDRNNTKIKENYVKNTVCPSSSLILPTSSLCIDYRIESCKITVFLLAPRATEEA